MKVCDRCNANGQIDRVEIQINNRTAERMDLCPNCEHDLYEFMHWNPNRGKKSFLKSTLEMVGIK